jgi:hypothetical protein
MLKDLDLNVTIDGQPCNLDEVEEMRGRLITEIEKRFISKEKFVKSYAAVSRNLSQRCNL